MEPLHDLKEHINNLLKELPKHLTNEEKVLFEEAVEAVISTKEKLRGSDYRPCCVVLALHLGGNFRLTIRRLLYSLAELCELLYAPAEKRTPRFILRLHNVTFSHMIAVRRVFQSPQVLTYRKLYGIYYHSITCHAGFTSRLISLSSVDTEEEERQFSTINAISKATSNGHPEHIIPNCIIRAQAEQKFRCKKSCFADQQSKIELESLPHIFLTSQTLSFLKSYLKVKCTRHTLSRLVIFCFVEKEYGGTQMKRVKKLYSMTAKDNLNFETKGLQCITFVPLPFIVKGSILRGSGTNTLREEIFYYPSKRLRCMTLVGP